jgi:hypothetical protein
LKQAYDTIEVINEEGDPELEIVYMVGNATQNRIGICLGKKIIRNEIEIKSIMIFRRNLEDRFELDHTAPFTMQEVCP